MMTLCPAATPQSPYYITRPNIKDAIFPSFQISQNWIQVELGKNESICEEKSCSKKKIIQLKVKSTGILSEKNLVFFHFISARYLHTANILLSNSSEDDDVR